MKRIPRIACGIAVVALFAPAVSSQTKKGLTVDTVLEWRGAADPRISPDGSRIAYVYEFPDKMEDATRSNLWIVSTDGQDNRPITEGKFRDSSPRWSPDGKRLAFLSNRGGRSQIYIRWMDTGQEAPMTDLQEGPSNLAWSPDGRDIAFTKLVPAKSPSGVKMPEKPKGAKWAEPPIVLDRLWYRQDGQGYRPYGVTHVFVLPAAGGAPRQLTSGDFDHGAPEWTPDGAAILTSAARRPDADYDMEGTDVYRVSVKDGAYRQLTNRKGPEDGPVISPDGKRIAYIGFDEKRYSYTVRNLYVGNADGSGPRLVTEKLDRDVSNIQWAPDSTGVYFTAQDRGSTNLYFAGSPGEPRQITTGVQQLTSVDVGPNGRIAAIHTNPQEPGDVVTFTATQPQMKRLTSVNGSLLADRQLGAFEEIWYKSFDGKDVQGWIIKPPDFQAGRKYPMILYIHGGPHSMYGVGFNHEFQTHAANGYVVLYTNPRGSTGYGQDFGNIIQHKYPGDDFKDLMAGVDAVVAKGYVDDRKLAVTGGSGGGLLTAWVVGHTTRFAAAVSQYPVINWHSFVGTADGGYRMGWRWFAKWPWEDPNDYMQRSPLNYAGAVTTPTMIICGEEDWRTPMEQSEQFFRALKIRKIDSELVRIPDEPHGASRNHLSHRMAKVLHIMDWFDRYIQKTDKTSTAQQ